MRQMERVPCTHPPLSRAIQLCCDARNRILFGENTLRTPTFADNPNFDAEGFAKAVEDSTIKLNATELAQAAYRAAMPDPSTRQGVRDYIACVIHGMTIGAISDYHGEIYLAAARVGLAAFRGHSLEGKQKGNKAISAEKYVKHALNQ